MHWLKYFGGQCHKVVKVADLTLWRHGNHNLLFYSFFFRSVLGLAKPVKPYKSILNVFEYILNSLQ